MTAERIVAIIPALDEAETIGATVSGVAPHVDAVVVADNGSHDGTAERARAAGAEVAVEPARGYGAACLAGIARAERLAPSVALFLDADGSEDPADAPRLLEPIRANRADLVLGIRTPSTIEAGAMTGPQRLGNWLAPALMRWTLGAPYVDMPPYKAIRWHDLRRLGLSDRGHGFTVEMLIRAHQQRLRLAEVIVACRARRGGASKVSGTLRGSVRAAAKILYTVGRHGMSRRAGQ